MLKAFWQNSEHFADLFNAALFDGQPVLDGYEAVYGQLKDVAVKKGDTVTRGQTIAAVAEPTRYYKQEGTHVYFAMTKDGVPVDPAEFTESEAE